MAFDETRRIALKAVGRITSSNAKGFLLDLDHALDGAGILGLKVRWRGDEDCGFTVEGRFAGDPDVTARDIVAALAENVSYGDGRDAATVRTSADSVQVSFHTWNADTGMATVCIEITADTGREPNPPP